MQPRNFLKILGLLICPAMAWSQPQAEWMDLTKVKRKDFTAYEPKDLKGYRLHDLHMAYLAKPYADLTSVGLKMIKK